MKHPLFLILCGVLLCHSVAAKTPKQKESYNFQRGVEAANNNDMQTSINYLSQAIQEDPKNGYAYAWLTAAQASNGEYGKALTSINYALKYLPKSDKYYCGWSYKMRAIVNLNLGDTLAAIADYTQAIKLDPTIYDYYEQRADIYFETKQYDLGNADYKQMMKMEPGNTMAYMGYGRNLREMKQYDEAIKQFSYVIKLEPEYSSGYSFRAECYMKQEKFEDALEDIIKALDLNGDRKALQLLVEFKDDAFAFAIAKVKLKIAMNPNTPLWYLYAAYMYDENKSYGKAIDMFKAANKLDADPWYDSRIALAYMRLGLWNDALQHYRICLEADSTSGEYQLAIANVYNEMDSVDKAIEYASKAISLSPNNSWWYYRRGWYKDNAGMLEDAIEDYTLSFIVDPKYAYALLSRGKLYDRLGKHDLAKKDFQKVITLEKEPNDDACAQYAYLHLGDTATALAFMDSVLAKYPDNVYDAACIYSLIKDTTRSLECLRQAFEGGFRRFVHLMKDDDMDYVRTTNGFRLLYDEYWAIYQGELTPDLPADSLTKEVVYEIPFTSANGVTKVDCTINGLPLNFVFDTGASAVTISQTEANFMYKNGYLSERDVVGKQRFATADGSVHVGTMFIINKINFGGLELNGVQASVVGNQQAPLLLGQTVLKRLGKIEIDNERRILRITAKCKQ